MDAVGIVGYQIEAAKGQLERVLKGLDDSSLPCKASDQAFTIGEVIEHLAEAYQAVITQAEGGKHKWGSFHLKSSTVSDMVSEALALRDEAVSKVLKPDEESLKLASDFLIAHDNYHIGQLVTARLGYSPSWNSYEIYGEG